MAADAPQTAVCSGPGGYSRLRDGPLDGSQRRSHALMVPEVLLLIHAVATFVVAGNMWFVQIAYYPNLAAVGREAFVGYQKEHVRRITAVAWTMLTIELVTGVALVVLRPPAIALAVAIVNAALIASIWWSTWFVQVPLHHLLEQGWDESAHRRLVGTNWFRTVVYTVRGLLVVYLLWVLMDA